MFTGEEWLVRGNVPLLDVGAFRYHTLQGQFSPRLKQDGKCLQGVT
jgi:hypothetical protein